MGLFLLTLGIGNFCIAPDRAVHRNMLGHDFLVFYAAGTFAREGRIDQLYDLQTIKKFEFDTGRAADLEMGKSFGPWWNPPFVAWMFAPLSVLPYGSALAVWWWINLVSLLGAIVLLCRMLPADCGWKTWGLVPLLVLVSMPALQALSHGQNTFVSLLLLIVVVTLWRGEQALWAGLVAGLLFYKPQLGAIVAIVLTLTMGRRALLGLLITGCALLAVNLASAPDAINLYLTKLPANLQWMQEQNRYMWERHITFKGFWRLLIQGHEMGPTIPAVKILWSLSWCGLAVALSVAVARHLRAPKEGSRDRLIAAAVASMPLLMPFYFDYDLLLVSVAAVLYASDRLRHPMPELANLDRWLVRAWAAVFFAAMVNTSIFGKLRVSVTVPLMATVAVMLIVRAAHRGARRDAIDQAPAMPLQPLGQAA